MHTGSWWEDLRERDHAEDPGVDGGDNIKLDLKAVEWEAWSGLIWLRTDIGGGLL